MGLRDYFSPGFRLLRKPAELNNWGGADVGDWTEVECFSGYLQPARGDERNSNAKVSHDYDFRLYCEPDLAARPEDAVEYDGRVYIVVYVQPGGVSGLNRHQEILVRYTDAVS